VLLIVKGAQARQGLLSPQGMPFAALMATVHLAVGVEDAGLKQDALQLHQGLSTDISVQQNS
jgi:hypothetical protein